MKINTFNTLQTIPRKIKKSLSEPMKMPLNPILSHSSELNLLYAKQEKNTLFCYSPENCKGSYNLDVFLFSKLDPSSEGIYFKNETFKYYLILSKL
jgi:hypothetical protein